MAVCCCSLAGTAACQHCRNNPFATDVWTNTTTTETTGTGDYVRTFMVNPKTSKTNADKIRSMTNEQLADWLYREACVAKWCGANPNLTPGSKECDESDCMDCIVMWLDKEGE